jgi:hypothetical protein
MLIEIAYRWVLNNAQCGIAFKELKCAYNGETPDVIGFASWGHSVLIECKASRSDYLSDKNKPFRKDPAKGMGLFRFYMAPVGLIRPEEIVNGWGLVVVSPNGRAKCVVNPYCKNGGTQLRAANSVHSPNKDAERQLMYSALRRLHLRGHIPDIYKPFEGDDS